MRYSLRTLIYATLFVPPLIAVLWTVSQWWPRFGSFVTAAFLCSLAIGAALVVLTAGRCFGEPPPSGEYRSGG